MSMSLAPFSAIESRIAASTLTMLANVVVTPAGGEPFGAEFDIAAFLVARYFGLREYGRLFGVHQGLNTVASALAPLLFAFLLSRTGSYSPMLIYAIACSLIGPLLLLTLGRVPRFEPTQIAAHP